MTTDKETILICGAGGSIGTALINLLDRNRYRVRVLQRANSAAQYAFADTEVCSAELSDPDSLQTAFTGVDRFFLVMKDNPQQVALETNLIKAAQAQQVRQTVKISAYAAGLYPPPGYGRNHAAVEAVLMDSTLDWTILRPCVFMQNFLELAGPVRNLGMLPLPFANARVAFIDAGDVAAAAASILGSHGHGGRICVLTGPESLNLGECARVFSDVLQKKMRYVPVSDWLAAAMMRLQGITAWDVNMRRELFRMIREGGEAGVTGDIVTLTGTPATRLEEFVRRHRADFSKPVRR